MIELRPIKLHWLVGGEGDDTGDLCAHSAVYLKIGSRLVSDEESGDWTASAASYYLLNALEKGHDGTKEPQLLPCCGMPMPSAPSYNEPILVGCPNGINWSITVLDKKVLHSFNDGEVIETDRNAWKNAVCQFSQTVRQFFIDSAPKNPCDFAEERGFEVFMRNWDLLIEKYCKL